jgi:pilus assembly protein CpaC
MSMSSYVDLIRAAANAALLLAKEDDLKVRGILSPDRALAEIWRRCRVLLRNGFVAALLLALSPCAVGCSWAAEARVADSVTPTGVLHIDVSGGVLVRLPESAGSEFIADPSIADLQTPKPSSVFVFGKKPGRTTLFVLAPDGSPIVAYSVDVRFPQAELQSRIRADSGASSARLGYTANGALLQGVVPDAQTAERLEDTARRVIGSGTPLSNQLQVAGASQVNLRVRVAEVSRAVSRQLGFNWSTVLSAGDFALGLQTGALAGAVASSLTAKGTNGLLGTIASKNVNGSAVIDALANEGLVTLLAEPNLSAASGATATFFAGGEFPIPIPQALGTVSVEYKQYGVSVAFTPTVMSSNHISIKIRPEVSELDTTTNVALNGVQIPAITARRAETTVELASGQSFAIAGLIQNNSNNNIQKMPWLGDVPVLGALFRSNQFQRNESELVIVVTPYIVQPARPQALNDATQYVRVPSDMKNAVAGRVAVPGRKAETSASGTPRSSAVNGGFVFE